MPSILKMPQHLLDLGRTYIDNRQTAEGLKILRRLLNLPQVPPTIAAEANYLIAQVNLQHCAYTEAKLALKEALQQDPNNARCHYLFAQSKEELGAEEEALEHYRTAYALAPHDGRMASAFALKVTKVQDREGGLKLLQSCYQTHGDDPAVVEDFVEGLIAAGRHDEAELVVIQAGYRNEGDERFRDLRRRFNNRLRHERLYGEPRQADEPRDILRFENFGLDSPAPKPPQQKPRGQKRPAMVDEVAETVETTDSSTKVPSFGPGMSLNAVLKQSGTEFVSRLYEQLGLMGKTRVDLKRREIQTVLTQRSFLASLIKRMQPSSKKLLKTVVQAGGYVPASVLFQNTGPDAPPPEYTQPLLQSGLLYIGKEQGKRGRKEATMMAVIPTDLLERLADILGVELDECE